ncbi:MAG: hypothetical protein R3C10_23860 [Pirellulales bacterium]
MNTGRAQDHILGSRAFDAAARITMMVTKAAGDDPGRRTLSIMQSNIGPDGLAVDFQTVVEDDVVRCQWIAGERTRQVDVNQLIEVKKLRPGEAAQQFLMSALSSGPKLATALSAAAAKNDISIATLRRAKKDLGIEARQRSARVVLAL